MKMDPRLKHCSLNFHQYYSSKPLSKRFSYWLCYGNVLSGRWGIHLMHYKPEARRARGETRDEFWWEKGGGKQEGVQEGSDWLEPPWGNWRLFSASRFCSRPCLEWRWVTRAHYMSTLCTPICQASNWALKKTCDWPKSSKEEVKPVSFFFCFVIKVEMLINFPSLPFFHFSHFLWF